jgi:hypothetical protein
MNKSTMSAGFAKFAAKTTKGAYDYARQNERIGRGIPFPVGAKGTAVVSSIICDETTPDEKSGEKFPRVRVELSVESPEGARGKKLSGPGLMQTIKDGNDPSKWSAEMAWGALLGLLEDLGLPEEISKGYADFQECIDWFSDAPRLVAWEITANNYKNRAGVEVQSKQITAFAVIAEADIPAADAPAAPIPSDKPLCLYRGGKHIILSDNGETYNLQSVGSGRVRENVDKDDVELIKA